MRRNLRIELRGMRKKIKICLSSRYGTVPVVLGAANYSIIMPPHSYINAMDFESPLKLAEYLNFLDQNEEEYLSYFWWRKFYKVSLMLAYQNTWFYNCLGASVL